jgi:hypothetical protein
VTLDMEVAFLQRRIARAEADRDCWRTLGRRGNYLQACFIIDALGAKLDELARTALRGIADRMTMAEPKNAVRVILAP